MSTCAVALAADFRPAPPAPPVTAPRSYTPRVRRHPSRYRYVRYCKAGAYQARVPLGVDRNLARGKGESVNLGLFTRSEWGSADEAEWAAGRAAREFVRRLQPGRDLCDVLDELKRLRLIPRSVLPTWVRRDDRTGAFWATCRRRGRTLDLGPFGTAKAAYAAMRQAVAREFPLRPRLVDRWPDGAGCDPRPQPEEAGELVGV